MSGNPAADRGVEADRRLNRRAGEMVCTDDYHSRIEAAAAAIAGHWPHQPVVGMVMGSGAAAIAEPWDIETRIPYGDIPHFPRSTALGHVGTLLCGRFAGVPWIGCQGRCHLYEGYSPAETVLPVYVMRRLGIRRLLLSNAAGGLHPSFAVGDLMAIGSHVDLMFYGSGAIPLEQTRPPFRSDRSLDPSLIRQAQNVSRKGNWTMHRGVYVGLTGPCYETRAEYRMLRRLGGDAAGMSTIPEIVVASELEIPTLAISIITNLARPDAPERVSGHEVLRAARPATEHLRAVFEEAIRTA